MGKSLTTKEEITLHEALDSLFEHGVPVHLLIRTAERIGVPNWRPIRMELRTF